MQFSPKIKDGDWTSVRKAIKKLGFSLGPDAKPTFAGLTISGLTTNSLIYPVAGLLTSLGTATNGQIPIGSTGATPVLAELTGTANQITITNGTGSITLATPQDIHTEASPEFASLGVGEPSPLEQFEMTGSSPYLLLHNSTNTDANLGRKCRIIARGQQSGGEESSLGQIEFSHDGGADTEFGRIDFYINAGSGLVKAFAVPSQGGMSLVKGSMTTTDGAATPIFFAATGATTGFLRGSIQNTGGNLTWGLETVGPAGVVGGASAYSSFFFNVSNTDMHFGTNNAMRFTITAAGLLKAGGAGGATISDGSGNLSSANGDSTTADSIVTSNGIVTALAVGIADNNLVETDHASIVDNDYAKFTANGLEGRSFTEVKSDLGLGIGDSPTFAGLTLTGNLVADAVNISTDTTTGTQIGTGATQKLGFFGTTPVVQQATIVDADSTLSDLTTKFNTLLSELEALGLLANA